ncbi:MAG TPA: hypothetical protein VGF92_19595 [Stellaceae bacterium]
MGGSFAIMPVETVIRFVTEGQHAPSGHRTGVFQAAYQLWRSNTLIEPARSELRALLDWFKDNLPQPDRLVPSQSPHAAETATAWIRESASRHLTELRRLAAIVGDTGIAVKELQTTRPGQVVYRDAYQVVALPFADTPQ